tara:strand:+ start:4302 stop:4904 length:603 start_codon:yes stop_codon:yes gene_type:complete
MADFNTMLPSGVDIQAIEFKSNQPTVRTQSLSGRTQTRTFGGQYWSARIEMPPLTQTSLRKVYAFLVKQKGSASTFTIAPFNLQQVTGTPSATEDIKATTSSAQKLVGSTSVEMTNQNKFFAGDMIKFSNHTKAYMITQDQGSDDTVFFEPGLTTAITDSHNVLSGTNFELTVRLEGDNFTYKTGTDLYANLKFDIVEAI